MDDDGGRAPLDQGCYDDMHVAGWDDFLAARERFLQRLDRPPEDDRGGDELSRRRRPASGSTCP